MKNAAEKIEIGWLLLRLLIGIGTATVALNYLLDENNIAAKVPTYLFLLGGASIATAFAVGWHQAMLRRLDRGISIAIVVMDVLAVSFVRNVFFACPMSPDMQQFTDLQNAIANHNLAAVNAILAYDHQPDYVPPSRRGCNSDQDCHYRQRPFDSAVESGDTAIVDALLAHGAAFDPGDRVIDNVMWNNDAKMLRYLIHHGMKVNDRDGNCGALWEAVNDGHADMVSILLAHGANPNTPTFTRNASSLLELARNKHEDAIVAMLERAGAKKDFVTAGR